MKTLPIIATMLTLFFCLSLGLFPANAMAYRSSPVYQTEQVVVFKVSPLQFRNAMKTFSQKYPKCQCEEWQYDFRSQTYYTNCERNKNEEILLELLMDGGIKVSITDPAKLPDENYHSKTIRIGIWQ